MRRGSLLFASTLIMSILLISIGLGLLHLGVAGSKQLFIKYHDKTLSLEILSPAEERLGTVVMIHGIFGSKRMLRPLATDFVRHGWRVILFDQPGHGGTEGMYEFDSNDLKQGGLALLKVIKQSIWFRNAIYNYIETLLRPSEPLIFLGHSLGGFLAIVMSNETYTRFNLIATIAISPPYFPNITNSTIPPNLLICLGKHDEFITLDSMKAYINPRNPEHVSVNKVYGSFDNKTAREIFLSSLSDHVLAPYDPSLIKEIITWTYRSIGISLENPIILSTIGAILLVLGTLSGLIMVATLPLILAPYLGMISGGKRFPTLEQIKIALISTLAFWPVLTIIFLAIFLMMIITIAGASGYIMPVLVMGYLFLATLSLIIATSRIANTTTTKVFQRIYIHMRSDLQRGILLGFIEAAVFLAILETTLGPILFDFIPLTYERLLLVIPSSLAIFAYFIIHEYMFRAQIQEIFGGRRRPAIFYSIGLSIASKIIVILFITILIFMISPFQVVAIAGLFGMIFVTILTEGLAATSYYATREIVPHSLASAIVWAFIVTSIFPNVHLFLALY